MTPDQLAYPSMTQLFLSDPVFLAGITVPFLAVGGLVWFRIRAWRRVTALAARNEKRNDETREQFAAQWQETAARQERMIALLVEIRDSLARNSPPDSTAAPGESGSTT